MVDITLILFAKLLAMPTYISKGVFTQLTKMSTDRHDTDFCNRNYRNKIHYIYLGGLLYLYFYCSKQNARDNSFFR